MIHVTGRVVACARACAHTALLQACCRALAWWRSCLCGALGCGPRSCTRCAYSTRLRRSAWRDWHGRCSRRSCSNCRWVGWGGAAVGIPRGTERAQARAASMFHRLIAAHAAASPATKHSAHAQRLHKRRRRGPGPLSPPLGPPQVMLDATRHPDLSDFVRLMVFNTGDPAARSEVGDLRALRRAQPRSASRRGGGGRV